MDVTTSAGQASRRRTLYIVGLITYLGGQGIGIVIPLLPIYARDMGASGFQIGLVASGFAISQGLSQPFIGGLSDRYGRKSFFALGLVIFGVASFMYSLAANVEQLIAVRVIQGLGSAFIFTLAMTYVAELAPKGREGTYMGALGTLMSLGFGIGPVLGGVLKDAFGMASAFYTMSGLSFLSFALVLLFLPGRGQGGDSPQISQGLKATFVRMAKNPRIVGVVMTRLLVTLIIVPSAAFLPLLMTKNLAATGLQIGAVLSVRALVSSALQLSFGRLSDRYNKVVLVLVSGGGLALATALVPTAQAFYQIFAIFAILGVFEALMWPASSALAVEEGRSYGMGLVMGVLNMAMSVGFLVGSMAAGLIADAFSLEAVFFVVAVVLLGGSAVSGRLLTLPRKVAS